MNDSQSSSSRANESKPKLDLRNPACAGLLTWLCPGAGHFYQRRYVKGAIYGLSVWILMVSGMVMGSYRASSAVGEGGSTLHFARVVYCSWRLGDRRIAFIAQSLVAPMAIPALMQARRPRDADGSFWSCAFAPPKLPSESSTRSHQPSLNEIAAHLHSWLDIATLYTVVAGFLNLLAIFDALAGPTIPEEDEKTRKDRKGKKSRADDEVADATP